MAPEASGDAVEGAARRAATETANLSSQLDRNASVMGAFFFVKKRLGRQDSKRTERRPKREEVN